MLIFFFLHDSKFFRGVLSCQNSPKESRITMHFINLYVLSSWNQPDIAWPMASTLFVTTTTRDDLEVAVGCKAQNIKSWMWTTEFIHAPTKQRGLYFLWGRQNFITKRCSAPLPSYSWFGSCRFADFYFIFGEILPKSLNNLELINSLFPANSWGPLCSVVWISTGGYNMKLYLLPSNGKAFICSSCQLVPSLKEKHRYIICRNVIILRQFHWN